MLDIDHCHKRKSLFKMRIDREGFGCTPVAHYKEGYIIDLAEHPLTPVEQHIERSLVERFSPQGGAKMRILLDQS
jgi:hypothetical protein